MNSIFVIKPYLWNGMWVFDDEKRELDKEPFVAGANDLLFKLAEIMKTEDMVFLFSNRPFPTVSYGLKRLRKECEGTVYWSKDFDMEVWFCPALLKYFDKAPKQLFIEVKEA